MILLMIALLLRNLIVDIITGLLAVTLYFIVFLWLSQQENSSDMAKKAKKESKRGRKPGQTKANGRGAWQTDIPQTALSPVQGHNKPKVIAVSETSQEKLPDNINRPTAYNHSPDPNAGNVSQFPAANSKVGPETARLSEIQKAFKRIIPKAPSSIPVVPCRMHWQPYDDVKKSQEKVVIALEDTTRLYLCADGTWFVL